MSPGSAPDGAFSPRPDDDDDVRWALSTALVQWQRGGKADAVVWLRRAGEAAESSGAPARATELRNHAARLAETLFEPSVTDDIDVIVDLDSRPKAPLPPPPAAVKAAQRSSQRPLMPSFEAHASERQGLDDIAEPSRGHFASAPEIVLEEQALDPNELEEILDYVAEDDVEYLEEAAAESRNAERVGRGFVAPQFDDRLSPLGVGSPSAGAMSAYQEGFGTPLLSSDAADERPNSLDRVSETEVFELRPSQPGDLLPERESQPGSRSPRVAFDADAEDDDLEDRVTLIPLSGEIDSSTQHTSFQYPTSRKDVPRDAVPPAVLVDDGDAEFVPPDAAIPNAGHGWGASPSEDAETELLDGAAALGIDADLDSTYPRGSVDLGADWAPMQSDRAPPESVPPLAGFVGTGSTRADVGAIQESALPDTVDGTHDTVKRPVAVPVQETLELASAPESIEAELIAIDSIQPSSRLESDSLPPLEFPSEPPLASASEELLVLSDFESIPPSAVLEEGADHEERLTEPLSVEEPDERVSGEPSALEELGPAEERSSIGQEEAEVALEPPSVSEHEPPASGHDAVPRTMAAAQRRASVDGTVIDGIDLMTTRGFEDLPDEVQEQLAQIVRVETLAAGEEVGLFGAAVVTHGQVRVLPAFADEAGATAVQSDVVFTQGTLADSIALRVVAVVDGTRVAVWDPKPLEEAIAGCPWVHDELRLIADRFLAACGATLGPLGERLDESLRSVVFDRLEVRTFSKGEHLTTEGSPLPGLFVIGGGRVEVLQGDEVVEEKNPGDFLFAMAIMGGAPSPATARAGEQGALVLFAPRSVAHELMISVPPLLEVLAG